jgi:hypothetical protein
MVKSGMTATPFSFQDDLAGNVARFEQLVAEHSSRLDRIEMLLDEIAAAEPPTDGEGYVKSARCVGRWPRP